MRTVALLCGMAISVAAYGQNATFDTRLSRQMFGGSLTQADYARERKLLNDPKSEMKWKDFPLLTMPRSIQHSRGRVDDDKRNEAALKRLAFQQASFVQKRLKGHLFADQVRVERIFVDGGKITVFAVQPPKPKVDPFGPFGHARTSLHHPYHCTWQASEQPPFKNGDLVTIKGKISDLKESTEAMLTLRDVIVAVGG
jgi:hypothetical protein